MTEVRKQGPPDARRLVASVLAVVERKVDAGGGAVVVEGAIAGP